MITLLLYEVSILCNEQINSFQIMLELKRHKKSIFKIFNIDRFSFFYKNIKKSQLHLKLNRDQFKYLLTKLVKYFKSNNRRINEK